MANLSKIKRENMLAFLETIKEEHTDDDSIRAITEIENHIREKKYGLVWEEHSEHVDDMLTENIPILTEDVSKEISSLQNEKYNFIIEGDNLQSLYLLEKTHKGKIDIIYIDPPYNRGKNDFVFDDNFVDETDTYRHSKWISFMERRLRIAYNLLAEKGVIYISINDIENCNLRLLCDEIFGEQNFVANLVWANKEGGGSSDSKLYRVKHEYIIVYAKDKNNMEITGVPIKNEKRYKLQDDYVETRGKYYRQKLGMGSIQYSSSLDYPIEMPDGTFITPSENNNGNRACWRWSKEKYEWGVKNGFIELIKNGDGVWTVYTKQYLNCDNDGNYIIRTNRPTGIVDSFSSTQGSKTVKAIFGYPAFSYPKDTNLIKWLIERSPNKKATVLDFFAGSGTTAQAVMDLNDEDGGKRQFILCTNNELAEEAQIKYFADKGYISNSPRKGSRDEAEWKKQWAAFKNTKEYADEIASDEYQALGICHSVTYPRISTVITGTRTDGAKYSDGHPANLKYFKCDWTPRKPENYLLSNALCLHIKEMIELQNGIEVDNVQNVLILNRADFRKYVMDDAIYSKIKNIWVNQNIVFNAEEMERLNFLGFKYIPKEFFGQELKEAAE